MTLDKLPETLDGWLALIEGRHPRTIDMGLERCGRVWQRLGAPSPGGRVVTVAGTNGKGSAVAYLAGLLGALGHTTASYTSPHLLRFNERLSLRGAPVSDAELVSAFARVEAARAEESLTYFEFTTLACLLLSANAAPDFALLEVGLGGRLDTVNLVDPDLALIMPIGLDHQDYLGADRETIGAEKAGILRPGIPLVCGEANPPDSVLERARRLGCPVFLPDRDYGFRPGATDMRFERRGRAVRLPLPSLAGPHQPGNLAAATAVVSLLVEDWAGRPAELSHGVRGVTLPGRLQHLAGEPPLLLDVAHNPQAAAAVAAHLEAAAPRARVHCVLGMYRDKDVEGVSRALSARVAAWYCAGLPGARGQSGEALRERVAKAVDGAQASAHADVAGALAAARTAACVDETVLVLGSFETVAATLREYC